MGRGAGVLIMAGCKVALENLVDVVGPGQFALLLARG